MKRNNKKEEIMKNIILILMAVISINVYADESIVKDYSFKANEFVGTPEMMFEKGTIAFTNLDIKTTGFAKSLHQLNILPLLYKKDNQAVHLYTWKNKVPAKRIYKDRVEFCDQESNIEKCDFRIGKLFFDFINENEGIMYYSYIKPDRYAYFYFDKELKLETRSEYLNRIKDSLL
jgi:hypothetical protein